MRGRDFFCVIIVKTLNLGNTFFYLHYAVLAGCVIYVMAYSIKT
jgi:hypothetical protein